MAGKGPLPKPEALRQRRNKTSTAATLPSEGPKRRAPKLPDLPEGDSWHPLTLVWWRDVWRSPMAHEYLEADKHGLFLLAALVNEYWQKPSVYLAAEIRQQRQCFGLTPIDRRRLQWTIEQVASAERKNLARQHQENQRDPRAILQP